ncbi:MAG: CapA family protein [Symbiobacteriia bacterium]
MSLVQSQTAGQPAGTLTLAFVGDILLADRIGDLVDREGVDAPWGDVGPVLRQADLAFGNLETSLGEGGRPQVGKAFTFQANPDALLGLTHAGIDAVSLANNHVLDYGVTGLQQTLEQLDRDGVAHTGAGADQAAAFEPVIRDVGGVGIGFLSLSRVVPEGWAAGPNRAGVASVYSETAALRVVRETASRTDIMVVAIHWGDENQRLPQAPVQKLAHKLVEAGADLVIGHHPHVWQGLSAYKGALIAYSLGNFVFTTGSNPEGVETGVLEVEVGRSGVQGGRLLPARIRWGRTELAQPAEAEAFLKRIRGLSDLPIDAAGAFRLDPVGHPRTPLGG